MYMKNILTLIYLTACLPSFSQTIFDFKIEQLYIDDGKLLFLNKGEKHYYFCEPYDAQLNDYEYSINLEWFTYILYGFTISKELDHSPNTEVFKI